MQKLKPFLLLILWGVLLSSCSMNENEVPQNELTFSELEVPSEILYGNNFRSTNVETNSVILEISVMLDSGEEVLGQVKATYPKNNDDYLISFEVSDNIVDALGPNYEYWKELKSGNSQRLLRSSCVASCHETFTDDDGNKLKGRGACKASCWATIAIAAAAVVATIVAG